MKILMYGWEFPPFHTGGLGIACKGIVEGLIKNELSVKLVLPFIPSESKMPNYCIDAQEFADDSVILKQLSGSRYFSAYITEKEFANLCKSANDSKSQKKSFAKNIIDEAYNYAAKASQIAKKIPHDIVHANDWLTFPAGIATKNISNKPLVVHVHSTEFDRSAGDPNPDVYDIELKGMQNADSIIAVSNFTKQKIIDNYGIPKNKITVIHNAIDPKIEEYYKPSKIAETDKIVLFLGRITIQKGPDYFLAMAKKVLKIMKNVKFVMVGDGDMREEMIRRAIHLGIEKNILFTGFLNQKEVMKAFQNADLYVMPSVSEPFGLSALEAIQNSVPVLISKQSGVSEVVRNALKVDFWDIDEMANQVISVLKCKHLSRTLNYTALYELSNFSWDNFGKKLKQHYQNIAYSYA